MNLNWKEFLTFPKQILLTICCALILGGFFVSNVYAAEETIVGGSAVASILGSAISWFSFIAILLIVRGFLVSALTVVVREWIETAEAKTIATFARHLLLKGKMGEAVLSRINKLEAELGDDK